jgi:hypothetical protein
LRRNTRYCLFFASKFRFARHAQRSPAAFERAPVPRLKFYMCTSAAIPISIGATQLDRSGSSEVIIGRSRYRECHIILDGAFLMHRKATFGGVVSELSESEDCDTTGQSGMDC